MTQVANRPWFRFSLRALFVLVTLVAAWLAWELNTVRQRREFLLELRSDPAVIIYTAGEFTSPHKLPDDAIRLSPIRTIMGDRAVELIRYVPELTTARIERMAELFPEADIGPWELGPPVDGLDQPAISPRR